MVVRGFRVPKQGHAEEEYEDALRSRVADGDAAARVAIADGATGSSFSGLWAGLLCDAYVAEPFADGPSLMTRLPDLGRAWKAQVDRQPLPWFAEEKARAGAFAAFLGLTVGGDGAWQALAVGDCCLFQVRGEDLVTAFPLSRADDFSDSPALVGTFPVDNTGLAAHVRVASGAYAPGDVFYLMTDALAAWFLGAREAGQSPWRWFTNLSSDPRFAKLVAELRDSGRLANDDVTLARVEVEAGT